MSRKPKPKLERLDDRLVPASVASPWPDSTHLTMSFPSDITRIAGHLNNLNAMLAGTPGRAGAQQRDLFRAVQTWAAVTNISVGIVPDGGLPFGSPGLGQGDPRFGDIRVGAQWMDPEALAVSIPHDPYLGGTWSGDVLFNSAFNFRQLQTNLFSVALHEFGHVFGLEHSTDPASVMSSHAAHPWTGLAASDIAAIRALYGARQHDLNDLEESNGSIHDATQLHTGDGDVPTVGFGDITTLQDRDYYRIDSPDDDPGVTTFRIQSAGLSLLSMRATLFTENGVAIASGQSTNLAGGVINIVIPNLGADERFYLRVESGAGDVFGIGRYAVAVTFAGTSTVDPKVLDRVLLGPYETLDHSDLDKIFQNGGALVNEDDGEDDTFLGAVRLDRTRGGAAITHFGTVASLASPTDIDFYRFDAELSAGQPNIMTATVAGLSPTSPIPQLTLFNSLQQPVPLKVLVNGNGTFTVQATGLTSDESYYLRVSADPNTAAPATNYKLSIDLGGPRLYAANLRRRHVQRHGSQGAPGPVCRQAAAIPVFVGDNRQRHLGGRADHGHGHRFGGPRGLQPDRPGRPVRSGPSVLLGPGQYYVHYSVSLPPTAPPVTFALRGLVLSDPIGPVRNDTTLAPRYVDPLNPSRFLYPDGTVSLETYLWLVMVYGP